MTQITLGEYTKDQLLSALGSKDLSNAKRTLTKQGYSFTTNGKKGNNYRITITSLSIPVSAVAAENFRLCCQQELGVKDDIDFNKLAILVCFLEYDYDFINLTLEQMELRIKQQGFTLSRKTISKYLEILENNNLIVCFMSQYAYYVILDNGTKFIRRDQWLQFWDIYYNGDKYSYSDILDYLGGKPKKRHYRYFGNALVPAYKVLVENAKTIVKEIRANE